MTRPTVQCGSRQPARPDPSSAQQNSSSSTNSSTESDRRRLKSVWQLGCNVPLPATHQTHMQAGKQLQAYKRCSATTCHVSVPSATMTARFTVEPHAIVANSAAMPSPARVTPLRASPECGAWGSPSGAAAHHCHQSPCSQQHRSR
jgi:hypothetical protein